MSTRILVAGDHFILPSIFADAIRAEVKSAIGENLQKIERLYIPQKTKKTEHIEGPPGEIAKKLVDKLRNELRVL